MKRLRPTAGEQNAINMKNKNGNKKNKQKFYSFYKRIKIVCIQSELNKYNLIFYFF